MSWKYIKFVGLELEAGWKTKRNDLHKDESLGTGNFSKSMAIGELISDPLKNEEEIVNWLQDAYTDVAETPACCAYHIHVSFQHINFYAKLMEKKFFNAFNEAMDKFGKEYPIRNEAFWDRLKGKNKYCQPDFRAEEQAECKTKEDARKKVKYNGELTDLRRTSLNYCFGLHKTIENRLFPTFVTAHASIEATKFYLNFIEDYLDKNPIQCGEILMEVVDADLFYPQNEKEMTEMVNKSIKLKPFNLFTIKYNNQKFFKKSKYDVLAKDSILQKPKSKKPIVNADVLEQIISDDYKIKTVKSYDE